MPLDPEQLRPLASSYRLSQLVYACAALGIPDALSTRPLTDGEIATSIGADPSRTSRFLRAAASEGVLSVADGRYELNDFSRQLCADVDGSLRDFVLGWSVLRPGYVSFAFLDEAIRTGKSGMELAFGEPFHKYMRTHHDDAARYEAAMDSTVDGFRAAAAAYDFSKWSTVVDVGGGQGSFLVAIIERHPNVKGILFDLPDVVAGATQRLAAYPQHESISVVGGDMFDDVPAGGDAYLFSTVLRCFEDEECAVVLRLCAERMAPHGRVVALEMVMPEGVPPAPAGLADLQAMVVYGGKDRTERDWARLFATAGFAVPTFHPAGGPYFVVEAALD